MSTAFWEKRKFFYLCKFCAVLGVFFPNLKEIVRESSFFCRKNVICYKKCVKEA